MESLKPYLYEVRNHITEISTYDKPCMMSAYMGVLSTLRHASDAAELYSLPNVEKKAIIKVQKIVPPMLKTLAFPVIFAGSFRQRMHFGGRAGSQIYKLANCWCKHCQPLFK